jgi:ACT domain-containing protein
MANDRKEILEKAKEAVMQNNLYFVEDIVAFIPISKSTFYEYFPSGSDELDDIKELLDNNKISTKVELRKKLSQGDKAAEILALYKLIATEDERRALSMQHIDHTTKGETINVISLGSGTNPNETTD